MLAKAAGMGIQSAIGDVSVTGTTDHGETTRKPILETWLLPETWGCGERGEAVVARASQSERSIKTCIGLECERGKQGHIRRSQVL